MIIYPIIEIAGRERKKKKGGKKRFGRSSNPRLIDVGNNWPLINLRAFGRTYSTFN